MKKTKKEKSNFEISFERFKKGKCACSCHFSQELCAVCGGVNQPKFVKSSGFLGLLGVGHYEVVRTGGGCKGI